MIFLSPSVCFKFHIPLPSRGEKYFGAQFGSLLGTVKFFLYICQGKGFVYVAWNRQPSNCQSSLRECQSVVYTALLVMITFLAGFLSRSHCLFPLSKRKKKKIIGIGDKDLDQDGSPICKCSCSLGSKFSVQRLHVSWCWQLFLGCSSLTPVESEACLDSASGCLALPLLQVSQSPAEFLEQVCSRSPGSCISWNTTLCFEGLSSYPSVWFLSTFMSWDVTCCSHGVVSYECNPNGTGIFLECISVIELINQSFKMNKPLYVL